MKTYVIHYKKLVERKKGIIPILESNKLDYEFIEKLSDPESLRKEDANLFKWRRPFWFMLSRKMKAKFCLTLSHIHCWKDIAANHEIGLILEDDAIFDEKFSTTLAIYIAQLPKDWDMLFLGDGTGLHIPKNELSPSKNIYRKSLEPTPWGGDGGSRCTDSYVISRACAEKIINFLNKNTKKINKPTDFWLNDLMRECGLKVFWGEPTIVTQGSQNSTYNSTLG